MFKQLVLIATLINLSLQANYTETNPAILAEAEANTWKAYYQKNRLETLKGITQMISLQHELPESIIWGKVMPKLGYAVIEFMNIPIDAPAVRYQKEILPSLISVYESIKEETKATWDPETAAQLELDWWVLRRNQTTNNPENIGKKMSELYKLLYGANDAGYFMRAAYLRAEAARYRDLFAHEWGPIKDSDWEVITEILKQSYVELQSGINSNQQK